MDVPISLIQWTEGTSGSELVAATKRLESMGYHELWLPEIFGREPFATAGYLLANTDRIRVSSGIANVYVHDADSAAQAANTLCEFADGRFRLGLGVSHPILIEDRGHEWVPPVKKMRAYLKRLREAPILSPLADKPAPVIVAGHGPGLMKVAAEFGDGSFLFLQAPETVKQAREAIGPDKELHVAIRCVIDENPQSARDVARRANAFYLSLPAYHRVWSSLGFEPADWESGGSDRLIDAICAWGSLDQVTARLQDYVDAGATHIVLYPCNADEDYQPDSAMSLNWNWPLLEAMAPN
ncbi:MAG: LLM class flavin-dependent oxidoreductase [Gammaproteobacteria bacterium]